MAKTASVATPKRVRAGDLRQKFNRRCLSLFKLPAVLRRSKDQSIFTTRFIAIGTSPNFEAMIVVHSGDFEANHAPCLHMNGRGRILVLLCHRFDYLRVLVLCRDWTALRQRQSTSHRKHCSTTQKPAAP